MCWRHGSYAPVPEYGNLRRTIVEKKTHCMLDQSHCITILMELELTLVTWFFLSHSDEHRPSYTNVPHQMILWWKYFFGRWTCVCNVFRGTCSATVHLRETTRVEHDSKNVLIILFSIDSHERNVICRCVPYILQHCADDTGRHMPYGKLVGWKSPMVFWETPEKFK